MERLLKKRIQNLTENADRIELDQLVTQLRRCFPEYQRRNKQQFCQQVQSCLPQEQDCSQEESDAASSDEEDSDASDLQSGSEDEVDVAIADFIQSERTESINRDIRELYGVQSTSNGDSISHKQAPSALPNPQPKRKNPGMNSSAKQRQEKKPRGVDRSTPSALSQARSIKYSDLGGLDNVIQEIKELVEYPLKHPEVYTWLGVEPPRGVLLHGPPGCGKTMLAHAIAHECNVSFFKISAPEIISGMSGKAI